LGNGYGEGSDRDDEDELDPTELDLEVEARWAAMEDLVQSMTDKAHEAVQRGREESRPVGRMVLSMDERRGDKGDGDGEGEDLSVSVSSLRGGDDASG
jgi:hypothetical protein